MIELYYFLQPTMFESDSLRAMRSRLETHVVPSLSGSQLSLRQRLSEGAFGTVYIADALGLPEYGGMASRRLDDGIGGSEEEEKEVEGGVKRQVAVKFLSEAADEQEQ